MESSQLPLQDAECTWGGSKFHSGPPNKSILHSWAWLCMNWISLLPCFQCHRGEEFLHPTVWVMLLLTTSVWENHTVSWRNLTSSSQAEFLVCPCARLFLIYMSGSMINFKMCFYHLLLIYKYGNLILWSIFKIINVFFCYHDLSSYSFLSQFTLFNYHRLVVILLQLSDSSTSTKNDKKAHPAGKQEKSISAWQSSSRSPTPRKKKRSDTSSTDDDQLIEFLEKCWWTIVPNYRKILWPWWKTSSQCFAWNRYYQTEIKWREHFPNDWPSPEGDQCPMGKGGLFFCRQCSRHDGESDWDSCFHREGKSQCLYTGMPVWVAEFHFARSLEPLHLMVQEAGMHFLPSLPHLPTKASGVHNKGRTNCAGP